MTKADDIKRKIDRKKQDIKDHKFFTTHGRMESRRQAEEEIKEMRSELKQLREEHARWFSTKGIFE